jgi:Domain of unknown function
VWGRKLQLQPKPTRDVFAPRSRPSRLACRRRPPAKPKCQPRSLPEAPKFERDVLGVIYAGHGDEIPVSAFPADGTFPTETAKEKR